LLDELAREGARRMLIEALKAEADDYIERQGSERDEQGHALVVRNGRGLARFSTSGGGMRLRSSSTRGGWEEVEIAEMLRGANVLPEKKCDQKAS
jgi:hypothetical protein